MVNLNRPNSMIRKLAFIGLYALLLLWKPVPMLAAQNSEAPPADLTPVLLTFDIEDDDEKAALERIGLNVPATFFLTGQFAERHQKLLQEWSKQHTIGSHSYAHPNFTKINRYETREDLLHGKRSLDASMNDSAVWFRAPYLAYTDKMMVYLKNLGFKFDSSDSERWMKDKPLIELPISSNKDGIIASDYEFFTRRKWTDERTLQYLINLYNERKKTKRPTVLLLHPQIIAGHKNVLTAFITYVRQNDGVFVSADQYLQQASRYFPKQIGAWVDFSLGNHVPEKIVSDALRAGLTDIYLMAMDVDGKRYFASQPETKNSQHDLFGTTVGLLRKAGIRVHAWVPVNKNSALAKRHPDWAMVSFDGQPSPAWLSPTHPKVRRHVLETITKLIETYPLDGIHLDYIRYPDLKFDYSPATIDAFKKTRAITKVTPQELVTPYYTQWTDWRTDQITGLVREIRDAVNQKSTKKISLSAALIGQAAVSHDSMDSFGQDYSQLAEYLDAVMPMAYFKQDNKPVEWITKVVSTARYKVGQTAIYLGLLAFQDLEFWRFDHAQFKQSIDLGKIGTDGIVFYSYLNLFGRGQEEFNMPKGSVELVANLGNPVNSSGISLPGTDFFRRIFTQAGLALDTIDINRVFRIVVIIFIIALIIGIIIYFIVNSARSMKRSPSNHSFPLNEEKEYVQPEDWKTIAENINQKKLSEDVLSKVSTLLRDLGPRKIEQYRILYLLDALDSSTGTRAALDNVLTDIPPWRKLTTHYLDEAQSLGYIIANDQSLVLSESGKREINEAKTKGYDKDFWEFVEHRLNETLHVECPSCGETSQVHWYWQSFDCEYCYKIIDIKDCQNALRVPSP